MMKPLNLASGWLKLTLFGLIVTIVACGAERESLFEGEHELPAHWPTSMADAIHKIDERLKRLDTDANDAQVDQELRELVEWIPEVAADEELSEEQWMPIYELCEVMREHLSDSSVRSTAIAPDFKKLQQVLENAVALLPVDQVVAEPSPEASVGDAL
jgi:hypothetical protein